MKELTLKIRIAEPAEIPEQYKKFKCYNVSFENWNCVLPSHVQLGEIIKIVKKKLGIL